MKQTETKTMRMGIDVRSTTTKIVVLGEKDEILFSDYTRHHSEQLASVARAVQMVDRQFEGIHFHVTMTGSGAKSLAGELELSYIQEVVANSIVLKAHYQELGTSIELGGQDAKIIFFRKDPETGKPTVSDMRMNGSCAGGTGAFIDEIASLLKTPIEKFDGLAAKGTTVHEISGRCGVYAKTDIQPLLNQGCTKADLALSSFHAIAKQTIGGLAQGLTIKPPVVFEGGPLTFNPTLIRVFAEKLNLNPEEILHPEHSELLIACGAAMASDNLFQDAAPVTTKQLLERIIRVEEKRKNDKSLKTAKNEQIKPFFENKEEQEAFIQRHPKKKGRRDPRQEETLRVYLGIDSGSTTTKFVLMDEQEEVVDSFYASNQGNPLRVAKEALITMREKYKKKGITLEIIAAGTTGYGEMLFSRAFSTETHVVETVAHARATAKFVPDATFLLDIGGQDMKAIWLENGIITNIVVNEACSSVRLF